MARRKKKGHEEERENHERWLISYADMITLLMVFFIVLFAMSELDAVKFRALRESLQNRTGGGQVQEVPPTTDLSTDNAPPSPAPSSETSLSPSEEESVEEIKKKLIEQIKAAGLERDVKVDSDERGVVLLLTNRLLFDTGEAEILPAGRAILERLTPLLDERPNPLIVEGHTDDQPVSGDRYGNWPLSSFRATNVLRFLLDKGLEPTRLTSAGYADTKRRCEDPTPAETCREENRRVEIILVVKPDSARPGIAAGS